MLAVKGPGVMQGYINDPVSTAAVMDSEGYFDTGDLVRINPATGISTSFLWCNMQFFYARFYLRVDLHTITIAA